MSTRWRKILVSVKHTVAMALAGGRHFHRGGVGGDNSCNTDKESEKERKRVGRRIVKEYLKIFVY